MSHALHISPSFLPGMKIGDILFAIAAVVAHSHRTKVDSASLGRMARRLSRCIPPLV